MSYRTYIDDEDEEVEFVVFLIHGHSTDWKLVALVQAWNWASESRRLMTSMALSNKSDAQWERRLPLPLCRRMTDWSTVQCGHGRTRSMNWLLSRCVRLPVRTRTGHQLAILLKERSIDFQEVSDLLGVETLTYDKGSLDLTFKKLGKALEGIYREMGGEDEWDMIRSGLVVLCAFRSDRWYFNWPPQAQ